MYEHLADCGRVLRARARSWVGRWTPRRTSRRTPTRTLAWALAGTITAALLQPAFARELTLDPDQMIEVELASVALDPLTRTPLVLLRDLEAGDVVAIVIGVAEAQAILLALHGAEVPRPMTHDLMANLLHTFGATLEKVYIDSLVGSTYLGMLELRVNGREGPVRIDSRPSDGMALAVRTGARIYVAPAILEEAREREFEELPDDQVASAIGITVVEIAEDIRESLGLPGRPGVIVNQARGEAAQAGITAGAMILEVNGRAVDSPMQFLDAIRATPRESKVRIRYWHDGEEAEVELEPAPPRQRQRQSDEPMIRA
jgi:uncharacterized protein